MPKQYALNKVTGHSKYKHKKKSVHCQKINKKILGILEKAIYSESRCINIYQKSYPNRNMYYKYFLFPMLYKYT